MSDEAAVRAESAVGTSEPDLHGQEILVPGGHGAAFAAKAGQLVEIVDLEGQQVADFVAFAERNRTEWLSTTHIRSALLRLTVRVGDRLESNWRRPMFRILRDDVGKLPLDISHLLRRDVLPGFGNTQDHADVLGREEALRHRHE